MKKTHIEWNEAKNKENQLKHNVSFSLAQRTFFDPRRVIVEDLTHSSEEDIFYCIGRVQDGFITVRFTYRDILSVSMAQDTGEKGEEYMKSKIKYIEEPMENLRVIENFLPPPDQLVLKEEKVKVTISLKKPALIFSKKRPRSITPLIKK